MNKHDFVGGADASPAFRVKGRCFLKRRWKSPYLIDYLSFAMICCVLLSALFLFINFHNVKKMESVQNQKKFNDSGQKRVILKNPVYLDI